MNKEPSSQDKIIALEELAGRKIISVITFEKPFVKNTPVDDEENAYAITIVLEPAEGEELPKVYSICGSNVTRPFLFEETSFSIINK